VFDIGPEKLVFLLVLALIVLGPRRLPQIARSLGRGLRELQRASSEVQRSLSQALDEPETAGGDEGATLTEVRPPPAEPAGGVAMNDSEKGQR
jgi:Tat protein translocase TatB subunit